MRQVTLLDCLLRKSGFNLIDGVWTMKTASDHAGLTNTTKGVRIDESVSVSASESSRVQGDKPANTGGAEGPTSSDQ